MQKNQMADEEENQYGVLLYYKYASIPDIEELYNFYDSNCTSLSLLGRVRVASHGVNVTVGGKLSALKEHIDAVKSNSLFEGTDFKLASCNHPTSDRVAKECGFTSLSIRIVKELVTLSSHPLLKPPEISNAGKHLSAVEFHSVINNAGKVLETESMNELVLLDARNLYETRIGKFQSPKVKTLDPEIRQYSDLPTWIESNSEHLRGKHILMYCTGGIRCEMASAYIKSKGGDFENVYQLYGGIQRYLEQFPEGGFFKGKNFVFDHRVAVGSSDSKIIGNCLLCGCEFDDYSSRSRCAYCRMLVLVCDNCQKKSAVYMCELCKKFGKIDRPCESIENSKLSTAISIPLESHCISDHTSLANQCPLGHGLGPSRKLRILCLHGFRQNASSFKGRTASLAKKLKAIAELRFVDAPHELPFIYQLPSRHSSDPSFPLPNPLPPTDNCKKKFAWLVAPDFSKTTESDWKQADGPFDPLQYEQQTEGFDTSVAYIENIISQAGPFDGILGFSQGAAMAALLCAHGLQEGSTNFRFAILCSGFAVNLSDCERNSINCPSLHIFGSDQGQDRQVTSQTSRALASFFENGCSVVIEHDSGHIIPTRPPYIDQVKDFLRQFL